MAVIAAVLIVLIALAIIFEVVMRYFFNKPTIWTVEVSRFALVYITFLGAAWVLKEDGHVKIDMLLNRISPRSQALLNAITSIIAALVCIIITWYGIKVTIESIQIGYRMETELRTPQFLILYIVPLGMFFFFVRFLRKAYSYLGERRHLAPGRQVTVAKAKILGEG